MGRGTAGGTRAYRHAAGCSSELLVTPLPLVPPSCTAITAHLHQNEALLPLLILLPQLRHLGLRRLQPLPQLGSLLLQLLLALGGRGGRCHSCLCRPRLRLKRVKGCLRGSGLGLRRLQLLLQLGCCCLGAGRALLGVLGRLLGSLGSLCCCRLLLAHRLRCRLGSCRRLLIQPLPRSSKLVLQLLSAVGRHRRRLPGGRQLLPRCIQLCLPLCRLLLRGLALLLGRMQLLLQRRGRCLGVGSALLGVADRSGSQACLGLGALPQRLQLILLACQPCLPGAHLSLQLTRALLRLQHRPSSAVSARSCRGRSRSGRLGGGQLLAQLCCLGGG